MVATIKNFQNGITNQVQDTDMNGFKNENNNLVAGTGQSFDTGDNFQTEKAVAVYASKGDFYQEAGGSAADVYVLEKSGLQQQIFELQDGMRIRFLVVNTNTGASTVNINALGAKDITYDGVALTAGLLLVGQKVTLIFDQAADDFILVLETEVRARVRFDGVPGTPTILSSFNVASVVKNATGDYTINFTNPIGDANYGYLLSTQRVSVGTFFEDTNAHLGSAASGSMNIFTAAWNAGGTTFSNSDCADISAAVI